MLAAKLPIGSSHKKGFPPPYTIQTQICSSSTPIYFAFPRALLAFSQHLLHLLGLSSIDWQ